MPKPPSSGGEEEEKPRGEVSEDLCEMALDPELLLLRDDGEEEFGMSGACPGWRLPGSVAPVLAVCGASPGLCAPGSKFISGFL